MKLALLILLFIAAVLNAQQGATIGTKPETKPVASPVKYQVLAAWRKYTGARLEYETARDQLCQSYPPCKAKADALGKAANDYNAAVPAWVKEAGLPEGSTLAVEDEVDKVTAMVPAKDAEPKK